jgi:hypothetical protein
MLVWVLAVVGVLLAYAAWARAGKAARKLEALNQSYWELRYDFTRLRSQVARLDPETEAPAEAASPASGQTVAYVSLSSMKKKADG